MWAALSLLGGQMATISFMREAPTFAGVRVISCASVKDRHKPIPKGSSGHLRFPQQLSPTVPAHAIVVLESQNIRTGSARTRCRGDYVVSEDGNCGACCSGYTLRPVVDGKPELITVVQRNLGHAAPALVGDETEFAPTIPKTLCTARNR
jgi:hypothetical protein